MNCSKTDVLVIGGGPAGSTFATLAKRKGYDVTILEKDQHPRFHIGESLLPMNLPILDRLGVTTEIEAIGVPKLGADFSVANSEAQHQTYHFEQALGESPPHAFEVRRSEFDQMLFANARKAGANAHEDTKVCQVSSNPDGTYEVIAKNSAGEVRKWRARFVVDASGRDTFLSSSRGWKSRNPRHASAAIFGHFRKVTRRPGKDEGNISLYWFEHGWIWMIPLQDDIMSIGAVCRPAYLKSRSASLDEFLATTLNGVSQIQSRMTNAEPVVPAQATGNYSYRSNRMSVPGALLVGDAYAFIDPVFSSGVYLAMSSAERGVAVADAWLQGSRIKYALACRRYERETRRGLALFSWFIYRFTTPAMQSLMSDPRNTFLVMQAVISMLAGDVYENNMVRRRLYVFKAIYSILSLKDWRASLRARRARVANVDAAHRAIE